MIPLTEKFKCSNAILTLTLTLGPIGSGGFTLIRPFLQDTGYSKSSTVPTLHASTKCSLHLSSFPDPVNSLFVYLSITLNPTLNALREENQYCVAYHVFSRPRLVRTECLMRTRCLLKLHLYQLADLLIGDVVCWDHHGHRDDRCNPTLSQLSRCFTLVSLHSR